MSEPSWQDLYDLGKVTLQTRCPELVVNEGDVTDAIIAGTATIGTAILARTNQQFRSTFLSGAEGDDLTDRAHDRGVDRILGDRSVGSIVLTRPSAGLGVGTIPAGHRVATEADDTGLFSSFELDTDAVFGALTLTVTVTGTCTAVGVDGNVAAGTIVRHLDSPFDPSIIPSNPVLFAGGAPEESDEDLRDRVRGFFLTQARGTIDALKYGARQVSGVDRVTVAVDDSGVVTVYVADAEGNSNPTMVAAVTLELEDWRDAADIVYVTGGVVVLQSVSVALVVRTGVSVAALHDRIRAAIVSRIGRLNPGETLYRDMIEAAVRDVDRENIVSAQVSVPASAIAAAANELLRTETGLITLS